MDSSSYRASLIMTASYLFEANYRVEAGLWYRFISRINGINYMEMLVNHALIGKMEGYDLRT